MALGCLQLVKDLALESSGRNSHEANDELENLTPQGFGEQVIQNHYDRRMSGKGGFKMWTDSNMCSLKHSGTS